MTAAWQADNGENPTQAEQERMAAIFRERAARLARPAQTRADGRARKVLLVRVGAERYGIEIRHLAEVVPSARLARVPGAASEIAGLMAFRGRIAAVLDLAGLLGTKSAGNGSPAVLILRRREEATGLLVDAVEDLLEIDSGETSAEAGRFTRPAGDSGLWLLQVDALIEQHPVMKSLLGGNE